MSVAVVKLGVGNTASVMFALERAGADAVLTDDAAQIGAAERVILPGVGAAGRAMELMRERKLTATLKAFPRPLLGICLGQQLLYESSEESGAETLGVLPGRVTRLPASRATPSPHMGWTRLRREREHPLFEGVADGAYAYFVHSYVCPLEAETIVSAEYGARFGAAVAQGNFFGCQFHPERSGATGARVLRNFLRLPC